MMLRQLGVPATVHRHQCAPLRPQQISVVRPAVVSRKLVTAAKASLTTKDASTGIEFPLAAKFWSGETFRSLGAGSRLKKILVVNVKVYAVSAYVEADKAAKELGIRERGGFFATDDDYCQALLDGAFDKVLVIHLVRDVDGQQFTEALDKYLQPRMQLSGELDKLADFKQFFNNKTLSNNTEVVLYWNLAGTLDVAITPPATGVQDYSKVQAGLRLNSQSMCRAMFEIFLGSNSVVSEARAAWVQGAKSLLESENSKRSSRKN